MNSAALNRVVTISATYGAGGSVVAPRLAERLGIAFFDRLIKDVDSVSAGTIVERLTDAEREQAPPAGILSSLANLTSVLGLPVPGADAEPRGQLKRQVETSVNVVASSSDCVILGRAAAVVLSGRPLAFHVRLTGPADRRLARAMMIEGATEEQARTRQIDTDKAWSRFVSRLFDRDPADPALYHLVIDSTALTLESCVDLVALGASAFWSVPPGQ
jgi:cytidylate kinase